MSEDKLLQAAIRFRDFLLGSAVVSEIAKIVVFGSGAKGAATPESDVDILIVTRDGETVARQIDDLLLDFQSSHAAPVEIVTCSLREIFPPTDYFLLNVLRYGKEIYSMPSEEIKRAAAGDLAALGREYLEASEEALERDRRRLAVDGGYNAAELAAKGLILLKRDELPGSHGGIVQLFASLYVQSGEIEREVGRRLNTALRLRNMARYRLDASISRQDVEDVLELARRLLEQLERRVSV